MVDHVAGAQVVDHVAGVQVMVDPVAGFQVFDQVAGDQVMVDQVAGVQGLDQVAGVQVLVRFKWREFRCWINGGSSGSRESSGGNTVGGSLLMRFAR